MLKYLEICNQISIYGRIFGEMVEFEFEFTYKLCVAIQQRTLYILRILELCCALFMNPQVFADLVASYVFNKLPKDA